VRLWYPAGISSIRSVIPSAWSGSAATVGAKAADDQFPLLLGFSGWNGSLHGNVVLSQALASHGFVVAAIGYPSGRNVPSRAIPMDFSSAEAFATTLALADLRARLQADTASFVLDMLARPDATGRSRCGVDRTDDACVGVFGLSFGGAVAAQLAWQDTRVRAVMNLDGWLFGDAAIQHFAQPCLIVSDDTPLPDEAELCAENVTRRNRAQLTDRDARWQDAQLAHGGGYKLTVLGSSHSDFCDRSLLNPLNIIALRHTRRARRTMRIVQAYALDFFGRLRQILGDRADIRTVGDRFVFQSEVLFDTGQATLNEAGKSELDKLAGAVTELAREIPPEIPWILRVDGHTDKRPMQSAQFHSNWELSSARAIAVVQYLISKGVPPERLAAVGFGEFQPIDPADTDDAYNKNRRIELKLTER